MPSPDSSGVREGRVHRGALASAFAHWGAVSAKVPLLAGQPGFQRHAGLPEHRHVLVGAVLDSGEGRGARLELDGRAQPACWGFDLAHEAERLRKCEKGAVLLRKPDGAWTARTLGCGGRMCPVCMGARAGAAVRTWEPAYALAADRGLELRHWTLTQEARPGLGGLVTPLERDRYAWRGQVAGPGVWAPPVGGESLLASYERLRDNLRAFRKNDSTAELFRRAFSAYHVSCEWTGRGKRCTRDTCDGPGHPDPHYTTRAGARVPCRSCPWDGVPRWHVHAHIISVSAPLSDVEVELVLGAWCKLTNADRAAQRSRIVEADRVREVIKYPFKPAGMTAAMRIEVLADRGIRARTCGGAWHSRDRRHGEPPFREAYAARGVPEVWPRLYRVLSGVGVNGTGLAPGEGDLGGTPIVEVWHGTPADGVHRWACRSPATGAWETWVGPAEPYAHELARIDPRHAPALEPGSDEEEEA